MNKTTLRLTLGLAIGLLTVVSAQAGSLEPPPGPVWPTNPPDKCFDDTGNRFVDCGNGTIKDTETGLFWLKDAGCFLETWKGANMKAADLAHGQCGLTDGSLPGDWRLPEVKCPSPTSCVLEDAIGEFASIFAPLCPAPSILDTAGTGCWSEGDPFTDILPSGPTDFYWSATTHAVDPALAWAPNLTVGGVGPGNKTIATHVWPVRGP